MAEQHKIVLRRIGKNKDIVKIEFLSSLTHDLAHTYLAAAIGKCFKHKLYKIIVDMSQINEPNPQFVATIIEATYKVRQRNGDIKLINVSDSASRMINDFNAYAYLTIDEKKKSK